MLRLVKQSKKHIFGTKKCQKCKKICQNLSICGIGDVISGIQGAILEKRTSPLSQAPSNEGSWVVMKWTPLGLKNDKNGMFCQKKIFLLDANQKSESAVGVGGGGQCPRGPT